MKTNGDCRRRPVILGAGTVIRDLVRIDPHNRADFFALRAAGRAAAAVGATFLVGAVCVVTAPRVRGVPPVSAPEVPRAVAAPPPTADCEPESKVAPLLP